MLKQFLSSCRTAIRGIDVRNLGHEQLKTKLEPLISMSAELSISDFGVDATFATESGNINYLSLIDDTDLLVGVFILPPGKVIPLHDHPGMFVISRVLYGKLTMTSVDWKSQKDRNQGIYQGKSSSIIMAYDMNGKLRTLGGDGRVTDMKTVKAPDTHVLYPERFNIHEFRADEELGCAVLDIIAPPYDELNERPCTYYSISPSRGEKDAVLTVDDISPDQEVYLTPVDSPQDFQVDSFEFQIPS